MSSSEEKPSAQIGTIDWQVQLHQHQRWLRTVILARCGEVQAVDEVFQEVAAAAVEQKSPIDDASKVGAWLYQLAVRQSLMYRRKQGRRRKLERNYATRGGSLIGQRETGDPLQWILSDERRKMIRDAVKQLPPRDAELLMLKYTENWSYKQIADRVDLTTSAVESRLHRARKRLRQILTSAQVEV